MKAKNQSLFSPLSRGFKRLTTYQTRTTQVIAALVLSYAILMSTRLLLLLFYPSVFGSLHAGEFWLSILFGLRVDTTMILTFAGLPLLLLILPVPFLEKPVLRKTLGLIWGVIISVIFMINYGDALYFGFVDRHVMNELNVIQNDWELLVDMAFGVYLKHTLISLAAGAAFIYTFTKIFSAPLRRVESYKKAWLFMPLVVVLIFLGIRGKIEGISFGISDAFAVNKLASGNLALNGVFCIVRGGNGNGTRIAGALSEKDAIKAVRNELKSPETIFPNPDYPVMRRLNTDKSAPQYNIVIIMLESFSAKYVDAFTHNGFKVTPHLDALANNGLKFVDFYANGQRSLAGITSVFTGLLPPYGFQSFGEGLELGGLSYLGSLADENGYTTISMQSSNRGSFRVDKLSQLAGFRAYYGAEDIPHVGTEEGHPHFGVWDGDMLKFLLSKLNTAKEPFLSFSFTSTTHTPYTLPNKKYNIYPQDPNGRGGFLNTMKYVDDQIGIFMDSARKQPWFNNTIFFFMADHCMGNDLRDETDGLDVKDPALLPRNHIPLIVYAPKIFKPATIHTVGSQMDIMPSIVDLLKWRQPFSSSSVSLFDPNVSHFAYLRAGNLSSFTDGHAAVTFNGQQFLESQGNAKDVPSLKNKLLGFDSLLPRLLHTGRWFKAQ